MAYTQIDRDKKREVKKTTKPKGGDKSRAKSPTRPTEDKLAEQRAEGEGMVPSPARKGESKGSAKAADDARDRQKRAMVALQREDQRRNAKAGRLRMAAPKGRV